MAKNALYSQHYYQNDAVLFPRISCCFVCTLVTILLAATLFFFWPSDPNAHIVGLNVRRVKVHPVPPVAAEIFLSVSVNVRNGDVYWMELREVDVGLKYRGKKLGHVESEGYHLKGWGWCHVDGDLEFTGLPAVDVVHLLEDLAKGRVYFHASIEVVGQLGLAFMRFPYEFKAEKSCEILVNTKNHSILYQHCLRKDKKVQ